MVRQNGGRLVFFYSTISLKTMEWFSTTLGINDTSFPCRTLVGPNQQGT